jgi:recombinational DNA repair protein RecT
MNQRFLNENGKRPEYHEAGCGGYCRRENHGPEQTRRSLYPGQLFRGKCDQIGVADASGPEKQGRQAGIDKKKIVDAYCTVVYKDGAEDNEIMSFEEIKQSWTMSKSSVLDEKGLLVSGSHHERFTAEACKKTVTNRICKRIINSSDDRMYYSKFIESDTYSPEPGHQRFVSMDDDIDWEKLDVATEHADIITDADGVIIEADGKKEENADE